MSLPTGISLIVLFQIINKVTAIYGIIALFTLYPLSALQLSMYIYSLPILAAILYLSKPLQNQSPWHCLAFAYLYTIDSIVNALYTTLFGISWFHVLAALPGSSSTPGSNTIAHTAGFTTPEFNVSHVEVMHLPKVGLAPVQEAVAFGAPADAPAGSTSGLSDALLNGSSAMSLLVITFFWLLRFYAMFIVLAYARIVVQRHVQVTSLNNFQNSYTPTPKADQASDPFAEGTPAGNGWRGRMGRVMISIARDYWLDRDYPGSTDILLKPVSTTKFRKSEDTVGISQRERRRRSGTRPSTPPPYLFSANP